MSEWSPYNVQNPMGACAHKIDVGESSHQCIAPHTHDGPHQAEVTWAYAAPHGPSGGCKVSVWVRASDTDFFCDRPANHEGLHKVIVEWGEEERVAEAKQRLGDEQPAAPSGYYGSGTRTESAMSLWRRRHRRR